MLGCAVITTGSSPHWVAAGVLLASPLKVAVHSYVPATFALYPTVVPSGPFDVTSATVSVYTNTAQKVWGAYRRKTTEPVPVSVLVSISVAVSCSLAPGAA